MCLAVLAHRPHTLLGSGILVVEPNEGLLAARSMLLAATNYYVDTSSASKTEPKDVEGCEVAMAILSESLGRAVLCETAQIVRKNWPRARILIYGNKRAPLDDNLYDARIDQGSRPEALLAALLMLTEYPRNQSLTPTASLVDGRIGRLLHSGGAWGQAESDPKRQSPDDAETAHAGDLPAEEQHLKRASQS